MVMMISEIKPKREWCNWIAYMFELVCTINTGVNIVSLNFSHSHFTSGSSPQNPLLTQSLVHFKHRWIIAFIYSGLQFETFVQMIISWFLVHFVLLFQIKRRKNMSSEFKLLSSKNSRYKLPKKSIKLGKGNTFLKSSYVDVWAK